MAVVRVVAAIEAVDCLANPTVEYGLPPYKYLQGILPLAIAPSHIQQPTANVVPADQPRP